MGIMKTYILIESNAPLVEIANHIRENCQPFLQQIDMDFPPLYRGQNKNFFEITDNLYISSTVANRLPATTKIDDHKIADQWFLENFGIRYRSDHVAFVTSDVSSADFYGRKFIFIPIGNFTFCWSPKVDDMFNLMPYTQDIYTEICELHLVDSLGDLPDNVVLNDEVAKFKKKYILNKLENAGYTDTNLKSAILSPSEIMIHVNEYYLLDVHDYQYMDIVKLAKAN